MIERNFRSQKTHEMLDETVYRNLFENSPNAYLVLTPSLKIINGNDAFVSVTRIHRDVFAGRYMFDAFPGNTEQENDGVSALMASFDRVLATRKTDTLKTQRYDVQNTRGIWETRHWDGTSWAITDDKTSITGIVLYVNEIVKTDEVRTLINEAQARLDENAKLMQKVSHLLRAIKQGRMDQIDVLRDLLTTKGSRTIH